MKCLYRALVCYSVLFSLAASADSTPTKRFGVSLGGIADPYPALVSANVHFNLVRFLRLSAGYGMVFSSGLTVNVFGGSVDLFVPQWKLRPLVGIAYSSINASSDITIRNKTIKGGKSSLVYPKLGVEYAASNGFTLGAGYALPLGTTYTGAGLPYGNIGWFF